MDRGSALKCKDEFGRRDLSDHLMLIRVFLAYEGINNHRQLMFCNDNYLNLTAMKMIEGIRLIIKLNIIKQSFQKTIIL